MTRSRIPTNQGIAVKGLAYHPALGLEFYRQPTVTVAKLLLGKLLVREFDGRRLSGWIVEVEAYLDARDPASHSYRGPGKKNRSMYLPAGKLYVYSIHARYCMNIVTEEEGRGAAVLVRALRPFEGSDIMMSLRGVRADRDLARGPARLCEALAIDRRLNGIDLVSRSELWLEDAPVERICAGRIVTTRRIGIRVGQSRRLRFLYRDCPFTSGPRV